MTNDVTLVHAQSTAEDLGRRLRIRPGVPGPLDEDASPDAGAWTNRRVYETYFEETYGVFWAYLKSSCPPTFTHEVISDLRQGQREVRALVQKQIACENPDRMRYQVFGSRIPGIFSLGGDLKLFRQCIDTQDREQLRRYATACVDVIYTNATNYDLPVTTISLVQGQALGGGFEAALAANVVVVERQCKMGLPEVLFNLFPGMGAYQLLTQRLSPVQAERFIASGRIYTAEELYKMGLVDVLADTGKGQEAVWNYIRSNDRQFRGRHALRQAIKASSPGFDRESFQRAVEVWVDVALSLTEKDQQTMDYLLRAQARRLA